MKILEERETEKQKEKNKVVMPAIVKGGRAKVEFRASFINYFKRKRIMYARICVLANISNHQELGVYMKNSFQF